jgi:hypothetical protein
MAKNDAESRAKIAATLRASAWRRRTKDKSSEAQSSSSSAYNEDYQTPRNSRKHTKMLWEESHGRKFND